MASAFTRIAMWSGPRNLSTAMMRSWENRPDTAVIDEPLYAAYLHETGLDHPMRDEILAAGPVDIDAAIGSLLIDGSLSDQGSGFSVSTCNDLLLRQPQRPGQVALHGFGTALGKVEIESLTTVEIGIALDPTEQIGVPLDQQCQLHQAHSRTLTELRAVVLEK